MLMIKCFRDYASTTVRTHRYMMSVVVLVGKNNNNILAYIININSRYIQ